MTSNDTFVAKAGLMERMARDNLLPSFLLYKVNLKKLLQKSSTVPKKKLNTSPPMIPITFLLISGLLFVAFGGDVTALSLVFAIAFLSVLAMFVLSNIILRVRMERELGTFVGEIGHGGYTMISGALVVTAIVGNVM
jgi:hypothetical protein